jgi:hypothetical protein
MKRSIRHIELVLILVSFFSVTVVKGQVNVLTNRYNQSRTAANLNETILTTSNVNTSTFGKLGTYSVDGVIYAQPLYAQGVTVNGVVHNVLYVATMHDVLYAFDADNIGSLPLWTLDFRNLSQGIAPDPPVNAEYASAGGVSQGDGSNDAVADTLGIFGTPVIDLPNNRMFFVTHTLETGTECFRIREVDIRTGTLLNSTLISATVPPVGTAPSVSFYPPNQVQRPAIEYADGQVWVAFGSRPTGDVSTPWYGWIMTYDPDTLNQTSVFATSRTTGNSIWESGSGPAVDGSGYVYYLTANGGNYDGVTEFPESLLKFSYGSSLSLSDWYTPDNSTGVDNYLTLDEYDLDLSVNGPVLIPGTDLVAFGSKTADVYVLHTGNLGELTPYDTQLAQFFHVGAAVNYEETDSDRIVGMAFWPSSTGGTLYVWPGLDALHAFTLNTSTSTFTQSYAGTFDLPGQPATALALSANGSVSGTGILWAPVMNVAYEANTVGRTGILHAYNADNPAQELWNSNMVSSDKMGLLAKFVPPVVVNGKVYIANSAPIGNYGNGSVTVYGLKSDLSPHVPPYAALNLPNTAATYSFDSPILLSASAFGNSSPLSSISFVDGTTTLATIPTVANTSTYSYTWTSAPIGSHTLTAVVADKSGASTVSAARTINVIGTPTYSVSVSPSSVVLPPGGTANVTITVTPLEGYSGPPAVQTVGLKNGVSGPISQGASDNIFILTISVPTNASPQFMPLTIISGAGGQPNSVDLPLTIANTAAVPGLNSFSVSLSSPSTLGSPAVFTEGVPSSSLSNPDFSLVPSGTTCTGTVSSSCTVQVQFTPQFAGLRRGAFDIVDTNNNVLATYFFSGTGTGAAPALANPSATPANATIYSPSMGSPTAVAVDGAGDAFVLDAYSNQLVEASINGSTTPVPLGTTMNSPSGLALDAAGNLYIADTGNNRILKLPYASSTATVLNLSGLNQPKGLAVDGSGNLVIANSGASSTNGIGNIIEVSLASGTQSTVVANGLNSPSGIAIDAVGDVFIADKNNHRVLEVESAGYSVTIGSNFSLPTGIAVDGVGDVFISDQGSGQLVQVLPSGNGSGTGSQLVLLSGLQMPEAVALNGSGNAFVSNFGVSGSPGNVVEIGLLQSQTIQLGSVPTLQIGGPAFTISASATSGLPVTLTTSSPSVCSVSNYMISPIAVGTCSITATQQGSLVYAAALAVTTSFPVVGTQTINFPAIGPQAPGGVPLNLSATASSGLPVVYTSGSTAVCTTSGSAVTFIASGICQVTASQPGNAQWAAATPVTQSIAVMPNLLINGGVEESLAPWRFILTSPGNGTASLSTTQFVSGASSADIDVTQTAPYPNRVEWEQDNLPLVAGTSYTVQFWAMADSMHPIDIRSEGLNPSYPFYGLQTSFTVGTTWAQYTTTFTATATTSTARLEFHFASALGNVWIDDVQLFGSSAVSQTILWPQQPAVAFGTSPVSLGATASSGLAVVYTSNSPSVCSVSGMQAILVAAGTCSITASQPGNSVYAAATPVTQNFNVTQEAQSISFPAILTQGLGGEPLFISATASSGLPVVLSSNSTSVCTISGDIVSLISAGTCSIEANQSGNANYAPAGPVTQTFNVVPNMITNGGFETGSLSPWLLTTASPASATGTATSSAASDGSYSAEITVSEAGPSYLDVDFWQTGLSFTSGTTYVVQFWVMSSVPGTIQMDVTNGSPNFTNLGLRSTLPTGTGWTQYSVPFTSSGNAANGRFEFHLGSSATTVWLDDVQLYQQN